MGGGHLREVVAHGGSTVDLNFRTVDQKGPECMSSQSEGCIDI